MFYDDAIGRKCKEGEGRPVGTRRKHGAAAAARRNAALSLTASYSLFKKKRSKKTPFKSRLLTETFISSQNGGPRAAGSKSQVGRTG